MKEVKIKFKKFDIIYEKHSYLVLIPEHTENIRMCNYGNAYWGTNWLGDREAFQTLMYSVAVLGFNPNDKIIYFPLRKNKRLPSFDLPGAFPGEKQNEVEDCDLVMTTHDVPLQRSKWKKIKEIMKYTKSDTYTFNYDEERTEAYFRDKIQQWERTDAYYKEEYAVETMESHTLFYVFGRMQFQEVYLNLKSYLQSNLEQIAIHDSESDWWRCPMNPLDIHYKSKEWDDKKIMFNRPWLFFYDEEMERNLPSLKQMDEGAEKQ